MPLMAMGALSLLISEALKIIHLTSEPGLGAVKRAGYCLLAPITGLLKLAQAKGILTDGNQVQGINI